MYYAEETHEAIIDRETFEKVQVKFKYNTEKGCYRGGTMNCFSGNIICGCCGRPFGRGTYKFKKGVKEPIWTCKQRAGDPGKCAVVSIKEEELKVIAAGTMGITEFDENEYSLQVDRLEVDLEDNIHFYMADGQEIIHKYPRRRKLRSKRTGNGQKSNGDSSNDQ